MSLSREICLENNTKAQAAAFLRLRSLISAIIESELEEQIFKTTKEQRSKKLSQLAKECRTVIELRGVLLVAIGGLPPLPLSAKLRIICLLAKALCETSNKRDIKTKFFISILREIITHEASLNLCDDRRAFLRSIFDIVKENHLTELCAVLDAIAEYHYDHEIKNLAFETIDLMHPTMFELWKSTWHYDQVAVAFASERIRSSLKADLNDFDFASMIIREFKSLPLVNRADPRLPLLKLMLEHGNELVRVSVMIVLLGAETLINEPLWHEAMLILKEIETNTCQSGLRQRVKKLLELAEQKAIESFEISVAC